MTNNINQTLDIAEQSVKIAKNISLNYFQKPVIQEQKSDLSPVSEADKKAEQEMRAFISTHASHDTAYGFLGEEFGLIDGHGGYWILDPIDGTREFLAGSPMFGNICGFMPPKQSYCSVGALCFPALGLVALGQLAQQDQNSIATINGQPITTNVRVTELNEATLLTTSPDFFSKQKSVHFHRVKSAVKRYNYGGNCYIYLSIAAGWADIAVESGLSIWDILPIVPIIESAGAVITTWQGEPITIKGALTKESCQLRYDVIASTSRRLHEQALNIINK